RGKAREDADADTPFPAHGLRSIRRRVERSLLGAIAGRLSGQITGPDGAMEGVLVSARPRGSTITVTVVSDAGGRFEFPASKLAPGTHTLTIRAAGYDLDAPATATISAQKPATVDLKLRKAKDLAAQLTNA